MNHLTRSINLIATMILIATLNAGCRGNSGEHAVSQPQPMPVSVQVATVAASSVPHWTDATGNVSAELTTDISTRSPGRVTAITVKEGDRIRKGQPLVYLDAHDLDASIAEAGADVQASATGYQSAAIAANMAAATSRAKIETAKAQVEQAKAALATMIAKRDLVNAGPRSQERAEAEQNSARANAALVLARKTYDRMASLYKNDVITGQQLDSAKSELDSAQAAYQFAVQQQSLTDEGSRAEDKKAADASVAQAQAGLYAAIAALQQASAEALIVNVRRADMRQTQAQIGRSRAALSAAVANRTYSTIFAPFDGVVTQRLADPGAMAGPGVPLLRVQGGDLRIEAVVPESALSSVHAGASIPVSLDALGGKSFSALVIDISPQGDPASHTFLIKARLPRSSSARAGMFGRVRLNAGSERSMLIPAASVVDREGLTYVFLVQGDIAKLRLVSTGSSIGNSVAVLSGLQSGDRIAMSNIDKLTDNARISEVK